MVIVFIAAANLAMSVHKVSWFVPCIRLWMSQTGRHRCYCLCLIRPGIHASVEAWYFQLSLMTSAAVAAWKEQLAQTGLPQPMIKELLQRGYVTKASFVKAFTSAEKLDKFIESLLSTKKNLGELEDPWDCHPVAGMIRDLWETGVATPISEPESKIAAPSSTGEFSLFGFPISKLDASQLREMWAKFAKDFPSEALDEHSRPCRQLIQQVYNQKKDLDLRFITWKFLFSEAQCNESKQLHEKKERWRSFVSWLAEASGHILIKLKVLCIDHLSQFSYCCVCVELLGHWLIGAI